MAQIAKNLPAVLEIKVQSLDWEDALEKGMATHTWRTPWREESGGLQFMGLQKVKHN